MSDLGSAGTAVAPTGPSGADLAPAASDPSYPVQVGLNAPMKIARWRVIGNSILAIPHVLVLYVVNIVAEVFVFVAWFATLFTGKMPEGLGTFIAGVHRYQWRVMTYMLFLREEYPKFGIPTGYADPGDDPAWLVVNPAQEYSRLAVLFRGLMAIPQMLYGFVLLIAFYVVWIVAFFAVLFTGRWPEGLRRFALGVGFWMTRFNAWYSLLADPYPPFNTK